MLMLMLVTGGEFKAATRWRDSLSIDLHRALLHPVNVASSTVHRAAVWLLMWISWSGVDLVSAVREAACNK